LIFKNRSEGEHLSIFRVTTTAERVAKTQATGALSSLFIMLQKAAAGGYPKMER
jgi:hypothetical protein